MVIAKLTLVVLVGYLLGSIPFGVIISKKSGKGDIRQLGSGKTGATNVLRAVGKKEAAMTALLDMSKGATAVVFAGYMMAQEYLIIGDSRLWVLLRSSQAAAALSAIAGHNWPVFLGFKGGRGVSTFMGGLIALCPVAALFGGEVFIIGAGLTGYASLASIAGLVGISAILVPMTIINGFPVEYLFYAVTGASLIIYMHRDNIQRLLAGKERKLGEKAERAEDTK